MPSLSNHSSRPGNNDNDNDSDTEPRTQNGQPESNGIDADAVSNLVHIVVAAGQKSTVFKKADLKECCCKDNPKQFDSILEEARTVLRSVFGLSLEESSVKKGIYYVSNLIINESSKIHLASEAKSELEHAKDGVLITILACIFMSGEVMSEKSLLHFLSRLGIHSEKDHPSTLGDVRKLLTEFRADGWIEWKKIDGTDPVENEVMWGSRADQVVSRVNILSFVCQVYQCKMEEWPHLLTMAKRDEQDDAQQTSAATTPTRSRKK